MASSISDLARVFKTSPGSLTRQDVDGLLARVMPFYLARDPSVIYGLAAALLPEDVDSGQRHRRSSAGAPAVYPLHQIPRHLDEHRRVEVLAAAGEDLLQRRRLPLGPGILRGGSRAPVRLRRRSRTTSASRVVTHAVGQHPGPDRGRCPPSPRRAHLAGLDAGLQLAARICPASLPGRAGDQHEAARAAAVARDDIIHASLIRLRRITLVSQDQLALDLLDRVHRPSDHMRASAAVVK